MSKSTENKEKCEHGFLQVDNQILDLLLCETKLNVYGVLILSKVREYQRKKVKCFISNLTFSKMFKTSESMIKRQITELYELGLVESIVALNDGARGKLRLLKIPRSYNSALKKILQTKQYLGENFKGQNSTLNTILTLEAMDEDELFKGQFQGSNFDFDPRTDITFKGQNQGSNQHTFKGHSDPITRDPLQSLINNKFLEGEIEVSQPSTLAPSLTSSTDDIGNATDSDIVSIPDATSSSLDFTEKENDDMENPNKPKQYTNHKRDEMEERFYNLNPIARYRYDSRYGDDPVKFSYAWGERERPDAQPNAYTPEQIIQHFTEEKNLDYLKQINWSFYWMVEMEQNKQKESSETEETESNI